MKNALKDHFDPKFKKMGAIVAEIKIAMFTTASKAGEITSRPMYAQEIDEFGSVWFFTTMDSHLVDQVLEDSSLNITFSHPNKNMYLSASGSGSLVLDRDKMSELWDPSMQIWYKDGLDTPDICLVRVDMSHVEYWDAPSSPVVRLTGFVKSLLGKEPVTIGEHETIDVRH